MSVQSPYNTIQGAIPPATKPRVVIEPSRRLPGLQIQEIWSYRELYFFLVWRDIKVRYKQSALGVLWIILQPLVTMVVFTVLFNQVLGIGSDSKIPYPIFTYVALLPWTYFSSTLSRGAISLVSDRNLISKIYFPRIIVPSSHVLAGLVDFGIAFTLLLGMMYFYNVTISVRILFLPLALLLAVVTVLGVVLWLSALNVQYRDIQYVAPFLVQIWMYATPIIYPISRIPEQWQWLYSLNPMVAVIQSFRWVLLGDNLVGVNVFSILIAILLFISGIMFFRHTERIFADVV
ncbi:MAG: ABC transporter permease [Anaerolineae bacterium]|nr:ABC transporter permease [Anaerolineae bacterium]